MSVKLLITSDLHGQFHQYSAFKNLTTRIKDNTGDRVINIDLGDFSQGSLVSYYYNNIAGDSSVFATAQNYLNIDYQVMGNHEFNTGRKHLEEMVVPLDSKILNANILDSSSNEPFIGKPYDIVSAEDMKIGIIGLTTAFIPNWEQASNYQDLNFINPIDMLNKYLKKLDEQVDYIVVLYHGGIEGNIETMEYSDMRPGENQGLEILSTFPEIDLLVTAHQHLTLNEMINDTLLIQPGSHGRYLYEITIQEKGNGLIDTDYVKHIINFDEPEEPLEFINLESQQEMFYWLNEVIVEVPKTKKLIPHSHIDMSLNGHPFLEIHNQIQRHVGRADFAFTPVTNDSFKYFTGKITNEKLLNIYPFYNKIATVKITGQELWDIMDYNLAVFLFENEQISFNYDFTTPYKHHYQFFSFSGFECITEITSPVYQRVVRLINSQTNEDIILDHEYTIALSIYEAVSDYELPHLSENKIINITDKDSFNYMQETLKNMSENEWNVLYENYNHLIIK